MLTESDIFDEYERLLNCYTDCCKAAENIASPNHEDNRFIKMAIVGFSFHQTTENWAPGHYTIAKRYLDESEDLEDAENTKRFNMLALGALLGLYSSGKIDDRVYRVGYILIPGFVMSKGNAINEIAP